MKFFSTSLSLFLVGIFLSSCSREAEINGVAIGQVREEVTLADNIRLDAELIDKGKTSDGLDYYIYQVKIGALNTTHVLGKIVLPESQTTLISGSAVCVGIEIESYSSSIFGNTVYYKNPLVNCSKQITQNDLAYMKGAFGWTKSKQASHESTK